MSRHKRSGQKERLPGRAQTILTRVWRSARLAQAEVSRRARPVASVFTTLGTSVLVTAVVAWVAGALLGWVELLIIATAGLLLVALCSLLTIGRTTLNVEIEVEPRRVVVGEPAAGRVEITNVSRRRLLPILLELPVGASAARFNLPSLASGKPHEELFLVPTAHRGVIPIGPATTVRGDPLGMLERAVRWTKLTELFVHPVTVPLESLGSGLLRDLEGQTTNDMSMSDLAFHTLREYAPGDDRRYIHWRSSAKLAGGAAGGRFLVRQFLDTRRSHVTVVVDGTSSSYRNSDEFEVAVSAAASVMMRAIRDEMQTTAVIAQHAVHEAPPHLTLDGFARAEFGTGATLSGLAAQAARLAVDSSVALLITGAFPSFADLRRAAAHFPPEVNVIGMRVDPYSPVGISSGASLTVMSLPKLSDLAALLRGVIGQ